MSDLFSALAKRLGFSAAPEEEDEEYNRNLRTLTGIEGLEDTPDTDLLRALTMGSASDVVRNMQSDPLARAQLNQPLNVAETLSPIADTGQDDPLLSLLKGAGAGAAEGFVNVADALANPINLATLGGTSAPQSNIEQILNSVLATAGGAEAIEGVESGDLARIAGGAGLALPMLSGLRKTPDLNVMMPEASLDVASPREIVPRGGDRRVPENLGVYVDPETGAMRSRRNPGVQRRRTPEEIRAQEIKDATTRGSQELDEALTVAEEGLEPTVMDRVADPDSRYARDVAQFNSVRELMDEADRIKKGSAIETHPHLAKRLDELYDVLDERDIRSVDERLEPDLSDPNDAYVRDPNDDIIMRNRREEDLGRGSRRPKGEEATLKEDEAGASKSDRTSGKVGPYEHLTSEDQIDLVSKGEKPAFYLDGDAEIINALKQKAKDLGLPYKIEFLSPESFDMMEIELPVDYDKSLVDLNIEHMKSMGGIEVRHDGNKIIGKYPKGSYGAKHIFIGKDEQSLNNLLESSYDPSTFGKALGYSDADIQAFSKRNTNRLSVVDEQNLENLDFPVEDPSVSSKPSKLTSESGVLQTPDTKGKLRWEDEWITPEEFTKRMKGIEPEPKFSTQVRRKKGEEVELTGETLDSDFVGPEGDPKTYPNVINRAVRPVISVLEKIGKEFAEPAKRFDHDWKKGTSHAIALRRTLTEHLSDAEQLEVVQILDGKQTVPSKSKDVNLAAAELRKVLDGVALEAAGEKVLSGYQKGYFPRKRFDGSWLEDDIELRGFDNQNRPEGHLEKHRKDPRPGYRQDLHVLDEYFMDAYRRISEARNLGKNLDVPRSLIGKQLPSDIANYVVTTYKRLGRREPHNLVTRTAAKARHVQALSDLGRAALYQPGQLAMTAATAGMRNTLKAAFSTAKKGNYKSAYIQAIDSGSLWPNLSHEVSSALGGEGTLTKGNWKLNNFMWGIGKADSWARVVSDIAGRELAKDIGKGSPFAIAQAKKLGFDIKFDDAGKPLPLDSNQVKDLAQAVSNKANFRTGVLDLPLWATSPTGKLTTQYSTFMYQHGRYVTDLFKNPVKNADNIARFVLSGLIIGEGIADVQALSRGASIAGEELDLSDEKGSLKKIRKALRTISSPSKRMSNPGLRALQNLSMIGGMGIFQSLVERASSGDFPENLLGPVVNTALDAGKSVRESAEKGSLDPVGEFATRQIPLVGHDIAGKVFKKKKKTKKQKDEFDIDLPEEDLTVEME